MAEFIFTSPDGQKYRITGPEGATQEQAFGLLQQQLSAAPKPIDSGDWQGLKGRLDSAQSRAMDMGPNNAESLAAVRQQAARDEGKRYGMANAAGGSGLVGEGVGRAMDKFSLGLPRLAEAYMPGFLGGQSALPGSEAHEFLKAADEGRATKNPYTAMAGNAAGIVGQAVAMPASLAPSLLGRMAVSAGQASALGAGESAIASRGDIGETAAGAGYGLVGGAIGQGVGEGLVKGGRALIDPLRGLAKSGPADTQATARILLAAKRAGIDDAAANAKLAELGPEGFLADVLGKHGEALARSSSNLSPEARAIVENASQGRISGQQARLVAALEDAASGVPLGKVAQGPTARISASSIDDAKRNVYESAKPAVARAYDEAAAAGFAQPIKHPGWMDAPLVQQALAYAKSNRQNRVAAYGENEGSQFGLLDDARQWLARQGFESGNNEAKTLAKKLNEFIDESIPEASGARALARGYKQQQEALDLGSDLARTRPNPDAITGAANNAYPGQAAQGFAITKRNEINQRLPGQRTVDAIDGTPMQRQALVAALGGRADDVTKQAAAERQFVRFDRSVNGGSDTTRKLMEIGAFGGAGAAGGYLTGFDPMQAGSIAGAAALGKQGGSKLIQALAARNEAAVAPEVARKIIERSLPKLTDANGKPITETARRALVEALMMSTSRSAGYSAGQ